MPTETVGKGLLCDPGALPQLVQGRGDGAMFPLELFRNPAGHGREFLSPRTVTTKCGESRNRSGVFSGSTTVNSTRWRVCAERAHRTR
jgi:hypothetical protein